MIDKLQASLELLVMTPNSNHIVHKSRELIDSIYAMSITEAKVLDLIISKVNPKNSRIDNPYRITVAEFCDLNDVELRYGERAVLNAIKALRETTIMKLDKRLGVIHGFGIITKFDFYYSSKRRSSVVDVWIEEALEEDLTTQREFCHKRLGIVYDIKGKHAFRCYEWLKNWVTAGHINCSIKEFKEMLSIPVNSYTDHNSLKQRVIKPIQKELADVTDIEFDYDIIFFKDGRKKTPVKLDFSIRLSPPKEVGGRKRKKGRKQNKKVTENSNINDHLEYVYHKKLQEELISYGVSHLATLKESGLTEEIWEDTLAEEQSRKPAHLVTTAKRIKAEKDKSKKDIEDKSTNDALKNQNRKIALEYKNIIDSRYILGFSDDRLLSVRDEEGDSTTPLSYALVDFEARLAKYLNKPEHRTKQRRGKTSIAGSSDSRKKDRRN